MAAEQLDTVMEEDNALLLNVVIGTFISGAALTVANAALGFTSLAVSPATTLVMKDIVFASIAGGAVLMEAAQVLPYAVE